MSNIESFINAPKKVFLLDAIGAFFSMFILFLVHEVIHYNFFNLPNTPIVFMYCLAGSYMIFSIISYCVVLNNWKQLLQIVITLNWIYIIIIIGVIFLFKNEITLHGLCYFIVEIVVLLLVITIECKVLKHFRN